MKSHNSRAQTTFLKLQPKFEICWLACHPEECGTPAGKIMHHLCPTVFNLVLALLFAGVQTVYADGTAITPAIPTDLVMSKQRCMQPKAALPCETVFGLLQKGDYQVIAPTKTITSRDDPEFSKLFSGCKLAPPVYQEDLDFDSYKSDPFYNWIGTETKEYRERTEGQFFPYGPFDVFDVSVGTGLTVRVIAASGFKGLGAEYPMREFYLQSPQHKCKPFSIGSLGLFYNHDEKYRRAWTAVILLKGRPYLATYSAWSGPDDDSGAVDLAPIKDAKTQLAGC
jgi:hypothetical protein